MVEGMSNPEIKKVYESGKSAACRDFVVYFTENGRAFNRLAVSVSKRVGNSVVRHRVKRIIKEAFRLSEQKVSQGYDFVLIARSSCIEKKSTDMEKSLLYVCRKLNLLQDEKCNIGDL